MTSDAIVTTLRAHEADLRSKGVARAALFESAARGEAKASSDLDIMVEIDPEAHVNLHRHVGITQLIAGLFPKAVDVVERAALIDPVSETAGRDAIYAF